MTKNCRFCAQTKFVPDTYTYTHCFERGERAPSLKCFFSIHIEYKKVKCYTNDKVI